MSLKKLLLLPLVVSLVFFAYYSADVIDSFQQLVNDLHITSGLVTIVILAVLLQVVGHLIRAKKMALLLGKTKESSVRFQFRALSVGYLFNAILPFRLGELIRARIISGAMSISFGFALVMILFERAIDAIALGLLALLLTLLVPEAYTTHVAVFALTLMAVGCGILLLLVGLAAPRKRGLISWKRFTELFNAELKVSLRFKLWSVIYGLQRTMDRQLLRRYLALTAASWLFYLVSTVTVVLYMLSSSTLGQQLLAAVGPYFGMARPAGPANLGAYSDVLGQFTDRIGATVATILSFGLVTWGIMIIPISLIGLVLLYGKTKETLWQPRSRDVSRNSLVNKLHRSEDISGEMANFLESFFSGNSLSNIVHRLERGEGFRLLRYFKGGSDAITILALQDGKEVVKKIIPLEFEDRLKAQHDWLKKFGGSKGIVAVLNEEHAADYYAIDLSYDADYGMFYEYIHRNPVDDSKRVIDEVWKCLRLNVHGNLKAAESYPADRDKYIEKHLFGCLEKAAAVDQELVRAAEPETIFINGKEYDNLHQIMEKIKAHPKAWADIANYQRSDAVHGDVIVDNLLVSGTTNKPLIIDPAPDGNIINGPVFDFGKNMQSLHCGYETMLRDEDAVYLVDGNRINYREHRSKQYSQLSDYVRNELAPKYLNESEQNAMLFHAAVLYIRRLKHQVYYTPANVLKFYAIGVKTLNEFLDQYERADS